MGQAMLQWLQIQVVKEMQLSSRKLAAHQAKLKDWKPSKDLANSIQ